MTDSSSFSIDVGPYRVIASGRSAYQSWEVWETEKFGRLYWLDGAFMASEYDAHIGHEALVHVPAIAHGNVRNALILGGGDGGSARELLRYGDVHVTIVDIDADVIDLSRRYLQSIHDGALDDPRTNILVGDAHQFVMTTDERYDLIVFDLTDPDRSPALHDRAFFAACKRLLYANGLLSVQLGSLDCQREQVRRLLADLRSHFNVITPFVLDIPIYGGEWTMACVSDVPLVDVLDDTTLAARIEELDGLRETTPTRYRQWIERGNVLR